MRTGGIGTRTTWKAHGTRSEGCVGPRYLGATVLTVFLAATLMLGGCAGDTGAKEKLVEGYKLLDAPRPDYAQMSAAAEAYLSAEPNGPGAAEALYLRGRAYEEKSQQDLTSPEQDVARAQTAYTQALALKPRPGVEGLIRTGLGNVLYFQNKFPQAITELSAGYDKLERNGDKAWALYRVGRCQQRVGQWEQADRTFAKVAQQFPGTEQARRAAEHTGQRAFWVQVGTYAGAAQADAVVAEMKKMGLTAGKYTDATRPGVQLVRVGPLTTYDAAVGVKNRVWGRYTTAIIVP